MMTKGTHEVNYRFGEIDEVYGEDFLIKDRSRYETRQAKKKEKERKQWVKKGSRKSWK